VVGAAEYVAIVLELVGLGVLELDVLELVVVI